MKLVFLALFAAAAAFAQGSYVVGAITTTDLTIQQKANSNVTATGTYALIYCSAETTITARWNGTAATTTAATIYKSVGTFRASTLTAYSDSNAGAGTTLVTFKVPATSPYMLDLTKAPYTINLAPGTTAQNFTLHGSAACDFTIGWTEKTQ